MPNYRAIINLTVLLQASNESKAQEAINGEFVDRLLSVTANKDEMFDFEFELLQIERNN